MSTEPWTGDYDKSFYWLTTAKGEQVKCYPNAGFMCAMDGSNRKWLPDGAVSVQLIPNDAPGGLHGPERDHRSLLASAVMALPDAESGTFLGHYQGRHRPERAVHQRSAPHATVDPQKKAARKRARAARRKQR